ncbi:unnamed protein product [Rhizopus stolonifer]
MKKYFTFSWNRVKQFFHTEKSTSKESLLGDTSTCSDQSTDTDRIMIVPPFSPTCAKTDEFPNRDILETEETDKLHLSI